MPPAKNCRLDANAWAEFEAAADWYQQRSMHASIEFTRDVLDGLDKICQSPLRWPEYLHGTVDLFCAAFHSQLFTSTKRTQWMLLQLPMQGGDRDIGDIGSSCQASIRWATNAEFRSVRLPGLSMKTYVFSRAVLIAGLCLWCVVATTAQQASTPTPKEKPVTAHAHGTFDVKATPAPGDDKDTVPGRFLLEKQIHGDIEGTSKGQMLTAGDFAKGSAGYVAIEQITGSLAGRRGSFALQHSGTLKHGAQELHITVVPGSGSGQLEEITGTMTIEIKDGKHFYDFDYTLPAAH